MQILASLKERNQNKLDDAVLQHRYPTTNVQSKKHEVH